MSKTCLTCMNFQKQLAFERNLVKYLETTVFNLSEQRDQLVRDLEEMEKKYLYALPGAVR